MNRATAEEVARLRAVEIAAERRYYQAVKNSDLMVARIAAAEWRSAVDARTHYVARYPDPYRDRG
jgi:hypothetical protein